MRTLLHVFATFNPGGPQIRFTQIANKLGLRYRHLLVAMDGGTGATARLSRDLDFDCLEVQVIKGTTTGNLRRFREVLARVKPDLLTTSNWGSIEWPLASLGLGLPHLHAEDGFGPDEADQKLLRRNLARRFVLRNSTVVVPSLTLQAVARNVWKLRDQQILYVPNGVDVARFSPGPHTNSSDAGGLVVGTVANLRKEKNLRRLIDAFARVRSQLGARLVIVGDGLERSSLEAFAVERGVADSVTFTGSVAEPEQVLRTFDVFAMSSDTEQMPLSLVEAMASGCAIAATDVGDIRHVVAEENRKYIVDRDAGALATAMLALLRDRAVRSKVAAANRCRAVECFDQERTFETYRRLWDGGLPNKSA